MSPTVCLLTSALGYPEGGGQLWVYLNWALAVRALGCKVIWLELVWRNCPIETLRANFLSLQKQLAQFQLADGLALASESGDPLPAEIASQCLDLHAATEADLLINLQYKAPAEILRQFRRTALIDIDPGLLQIWHTTGAVRFAPHDLYFSIGETVGRPGARFPDCGVRWHYTPPPVFLPAWESVKAGEGAAFTTTAHWWYGDMEWNGETFSNDKRSSFLEFLELPAKTTAKLELAVCLGKSEDEEKKLWQQHGWQIHSAWDVSSTAADYRNYIRQSRGEFSCAKPSCMRLQNAWISDRTLCYLASGKPAIVQHTGPSHSLPEAAGLFRFRTIDEASAALAAVEADYEKHCDLARNLAETYFDGTKVVRRVLETALT